MIPITSMSKKFIENWLIKKPSLAKVGRNENHCWSLFNCIALSSRNYIMCLAITQRTTVLIQSIFREILKFSALSERFQNCLCSDSESSLNHRKQQNAFLNCLWISMKFRIFLKHNERHRKMFINFSTVFISFGNKMPKNFSRKKRNRIFADIFCYCETKWYWIFAEFSAFLD